MAYLIKAIQSKGLLSPFKHPFCITPILQDQLQNNNNLKLMSFRSATSVKNLTKHAKNTTEITKELTRNIFIKSSNFSIFFSHFLANSKGKDKFIALFQYLFQFLCACGKNSNIPMYAEAFKNKELPDMIVYYNLKESISSARKVFRLFRFFDEIKGLTKILKTDKPIGFKLLSVFTYGCSITYYISDNTLWLLGILVGSKIIDNKHKRNWKFRKNFSSFYRVIAYTTILIYSIYLQEKENQKNQQFLQRQINSADENFSAQNKAYRNILDGRRKIRFFKIQFALSILRFIMLTDSLRLKYHEKLDPIFVGMCGLSSAILGFLKAMFEKRIVINIEKKDEREGGETRISIDKLKALSAIESSKFY